MFWDKKKTSLPDLPRSPMLSAPPMMDNYQDDMSNELPSFPDSPMQKGFSQSAIKEAVSNESQEENSEMAENQDYDANTAEYPGNNMQEWSPSPMPMAVPQIPMPPRSVSPRGRQSDGRPVYIRLDKFQTARSSLENVKTKLVEIEDLLKKIRDVKAQEDQELTAWESDLESVKHRLETIMTDVFDRGEE